MKTTRERLVVAMLSVVLASTVTSAFGQVSEEQPLAGTWSVTSCVGGGGDLGKLLGTQWKIEGSTLAVDLGLLKPDQPQGAPPSKTTCVLNPAKRPSEIDIIVEAVAKIPMTPDAVGAPVAGMGVRRVHKGVYAIKGDILRISLNLNPEIRQVLLMPDGKEREQLGGMPTERPNRVSSRPTKPSLGMVVLVTLHRSKDIQKDKTSSIEP
jgi:uncharacterized protein (TIGR03067 family)